MFYNIIDTVYINTMQWVTDSNNILVIQKGPGILFNALKLCSALLTLQDVSCLWFTVMLCLFIYVHVVLCQFSLYCYEFSCCMFIFVSLFTFQIIYFPCCICCIFLYVIFGSFGCVGYK